jgi:polar amino acid transport system substrate-binding protein
VYYVAGQKVLVAKNSPVEDIGGLSGKKVCAPKGTTTLDQMKAKNPKVVPVVVDLHTDCLALFQQGKVDAITGDDTILAGFAAQDPYAKVVGEQFSQEPYGLGIAKNNPQFTQFVNGVLAQMRSDGAWQATYDKWLRPALGNAKVPNPPTPQYGRQQP